MRDMCQRLAESDDYGIPIRVKTILPVVASRIAPPIVLAVPITKRCSGRAPWRTASALAGVLIANGNPSPVASAIRMAVLGAGMIMVATGMSAAAVPVLLINALSAAAAAQNAK